MIEHAGKIVLLLNALLLSLVAGDAASASAEGKLKHESFDRDPGWEGFNNRVVPNHVPAVVQDYGYQTPKPGVNDRGAIGGRVTRSGKSTFYAARIGPRGLQDKLSASGTFKLTSSSGNSGIFFGWFGAKQPGGGGRPINSLGLEFDGESKGARLAVRMISGSNKSCGTFITPFIPGKFRPTPIRNDGTIYSWTLGYDPNANGGEGQISFTIKSEQPKPEEFEGKLFTVDLPRGFKAEGAAFDHFGLMNTMKDGGVMTIYFGDLQHDEKREDFARDPNWEEQSNRESYQELDQVGAHDFGYSAETKLAGGNIGELGGKFWRGGNYAFYADRVGPLTLNDKLEARGKAGLLVGAPDSDMYFGWFNSAEREKPPSEAGNFLGIHVGGPTRIGHFFQPACATAKGTVARAKAGPVMTPNKRYSWSLVYDPTANEGKGNITVKLGDESVTLQLKSGLKSEGANFDRFGMFTTTVGGQMVRIYLDDLDYTATSGSH